MRRSFSLIVPQVAVLVVAFSAIAMGCAVEPAPEPPAQTEDPLKTKDHSAITGASCRAHGLGEAFCQRVQEEAYNVDHNEWTTLAAHSQPEVGQSHCDAAKAVQARLRTLGGEIHQVMSTGIPSAAQVDRMAASLGRSLHTIQDNCAHHGMTNPQHSWYSIRDWCISSGEDPDATPEALACAKEETDIAVRAFRDALRTASIDPSHLIFASSVTTHNPSRANVCSFLQEWREFDGRDARWNNDVTRVAFRTSLSDAITTGGSQDADICADGATLGIQAPNATVSVKDPSCITLHLYCVGE